MPMINLQWGRRRNREKRSRRTQGKRDCLRNGLTLRMRRRVERRRLKEGNIRRKKTVAGVRRITLITLLKARVPKKNALDGSSIQFILT